MPAGRITLAVATLLLVALLLISLMGVNSLAASSTEAEPNPYRQAQAQESFYHWYHRNTVRQEAAYQTYVAHMDSQFRLHSREVDNQLQVMINIPATINTPLMDDCDGCVFDDIVNTINDDTTDFRLRDEYFFYNTVRQPQDCNNRLFTQHYNMIVADPQSSMLLPLSASDYGRYYCFKVGLRVSLPGWDLIPWKIFVVEQPVRNPGHGDVSGELFEFFTYCHAKHPL